MVKYSYDAWGNPLTITDGSGNDVSSNSSHIANLNPFRYKGYYYDQETRFYYLQSRYYDPYIGRFINADGLVASSGSFIGLNLFAYCNDNPVLLKDSTGLRPIIAADPNNETDEERAISFEYMREYKKSTITYSSSHNENRRPNTGEPGSTYVAPNGDKRTYGPDGKPEHDYDHDDHGRPDSHPHDKDGGHEHNWENGVRGKPYTTNVGNVFLGTAIVFLSTAGVVALVADDVTGIGAADDMFLPELIASIIEGVNLVFD